MVLGLIAGGTILLGLPVGRLRRPALSVRVLVNAAAIGILLFLIRDILSAAWEPIDAALAGISAGQGGLGTAIGYGLLFAAGLAVGLSSSPAPPDPSSTSSPSSWPSRPDPAGATSSPTDC